MLHIYVHTCSHGISSSLNSVFSPSQRCFDLTYVFNFAEFQFTNFAFIIIAFCVPRKIQSSSFRFYPLSFTALAFMFKPYFWLSFSLWGRIKVCFSLAPFGRLYFLLWITPMPGKINCVYVDSLFLDCLFCSNDNFSVIFIVHSIFQFISMKAFCL